MKIQYGCGLCAPDTWVNFDSSPTITLQRIPLIGAFFRGGSFPDFPSNIKIGNISKGLTIGDEQADLVYCSHVLEHLSLEEFRNTLSETKRILRDGGTFRFVLPDLEAAINEYVNSPHDTASMKFMESTLLGTKRRSRGFFGFFREWLGGSKHLWMWDYQSMRNELIVAGFSDVRRAEFGDSDFAEFVDVEDKGRWEGSLGVECKKKLVESDTRD